MSHKTGQFNHSEESKRKISIANRGKTHSMSIESREKMSKLHTGSTMSFKGKPWTTARRLAQQIGLVMPFRGSPWTEARRKAQKLVIVKTKPIKNSNKEYDPNWHDIRKIIYERDNWTCRECNIKCKSKKHPDTKCKIQCHHIDYNERNNNSENLITLCASCHMKTNFNRKDWIKYFINKKKV